MKTVYIDDLLWDDENMTKIAAHQLTINEVYQALVLDTDREAAWVEDDEHGRRLIAIGTCEFDNKKIIAYLDPVNEAEGIWRPKNSLEAREMKEKKEIEELSAEEALTEFKKGKKVRVAPPRKKDRMSLYNLRIENETLDRLLQLSNREGKPASALAREILSEGLRSRLSDEEHFASTAYDEVVLEQAYGYLQLVSSQGLHTRGRSYRVRPSSPYFRTSGDFKPGQSSIPEENEVR